VTLRVSSGTALVDVPDVTGLDEHPARLELENAGFRVRVMDQSTLDPAEDGVVVSQIALGGTRTDEGGLVTLTVARLGWAHLALLPSRGFVSRIAREPHRRAASHPACRGVAHLSKEQL
jgi:PASTA domain